MKCNRCGEELSIFPWGMECARCFFADLAAEGTNT